MKPGLALSAILSMTIGLSAPIVAQDLTPGLTSNTPSIDFTGPPEELEPASVPKKLLWAWTMLINPGNRNKPIPLYGYPLSSLDDDMTLGALSAAAAGRVHIARLCSRVSTAEPDTNERIYDGQGLQITGSPDDTTQSGSLADAWTTFRRNHNRCDDGAEEILAFTRPLDVRRAYSANVPEVMEFVAWPGLWEERTASLSSAESDEPS